MIVPIVQIFNVPKTSRTNERKLVNNDRPFYFHAVDNIWVVAKFSVTYNITQNSQRL
jgi:hypothetical protein